MQKAEADLNDFIEKQMNVIKVVKGALKNKYDEISRNKSDQEKLSQLVKANEKENYNLEKISENKDQTIKKDVCRNNKRDKDELVKVNKMNLLGTS